MCMLYNLMFWSKLCDDFKEITKMVLSRAREIAVGTSSNAPTLKPKGRPKVRNSCACNSSLEV